MPKQKELFSIGHIPVFIALGIGVVLWFLPTFLLPFLQEPLTLLLTNFGLLSPTAGAFESRFIAALVIRWIAVVALLFFILKIEKRPLQSVGIKKPVKKDYLLMIGLGLLLMVSTMVIYSIFNFDTNTQTGQIIATLSVLGKIHLILNAAIVEELFYRGFLIERLTSLTQRVWLAGGISFVLFVAGHLSGSGLLHSLLPVALGTVVFVTLYIKRRNLFTCIGAHAISNSLMLLA